MLSFRMYADVRFNRPVDGEKDYISPGGYTMAVGGKAREFDFMDYAVWVDSRDPQLVHMEMWNPGYAAFQEFADITETDLAKVSEIKEFFVYTGEPGETSLVPEAVEQIEFSICGEGEIIKVPGGLFPFTPIYFERRTGRQWQKEGSKTTSTLKTPGLFSATFRGRPTSSTVKAGCGVSAS